MDDTPLEDGWQLGTAERDTVTRDFVDSSADYLTSVGRAVGATVVDDGDVAGAHHGAPFPFVNMVVARRPIRDAEWPDRLARLRAAFPSTAPFVLTSPFPTPDLHPHGFALVGHPPFMVRPAGPTPGPGLVAGLEIAAVRSPEDLAQFERTLVDAYPAGPAGTMFDPALLDVPDVTLLLARIDGAPVATAATHHGGAVDGVELVSCLPEVRGRGVGAAITAAASRVAPGVPSALIASDRGRPVYERLGYLAIARFTLWLGA